jgi:hypothetical protein
MHSHGISGPPWLSGSHHPRLGLLDAPPAADLVAAMEREHCEVAAGFGASDAAFVTTNYGGNRTTPRQVCTQPSLQDRSSDGSPDCTARPAARDRRPRARSGCTSSTRRARRS